MNRGASQLVAEMAQYVQLYLMPDQTPDLCAILIGILKAELDPA